MITKSRKRGYFMNKLTKQNLRTNNLKLECSLENEYTAHFEVYCGTDHLGTLSLYPDGHVVPKAHCDLFYVQEAYHEIKKYAKNHGMEKTNLDFL